MQETIETDTEYGKPLEKYTDTQKYMKTTKILHRTGKAEKDKQKPRTKSHGGRK